jgi:hypothetical protein
LTIVCAVSASHGTSATHAPVSDGDPTRQRVTGAA